MNVGSQREKMKLYGFNNLTKTLSFNMYDICYTKTVEDRIAYIEYIDEQYNAERLTGILREVANIIGAQILNISVQDYEPQGSSVTILISDEGINRELESARADRCSADSVLLAHLDKSHLTVHTYPEYHPDGGVCTFRADIDVSTCGEISPLNALNYLIGQFDSDIIALDYRIRGFTRDIDGKKYYKDHEINSIQNYIDEATLRRYDAIDVNVYQSNIFHTKMMLKEIRLADYLFNIDPRELPPEERLSITDRITKEMLEIYYGMNMY